MGEHSLSVLIRNHEVAVAFAWIILCGAGVYTSTKEATMDDLDNRSSPFLKSCQCIVDQPGARKSPFKAQLKPTHHHLSG